MTEKDLIAKLNNLKNINPAETWLKSNRELLLSQVSNSSAKEISAWQNFIINLGSLTKAAAQPVYAFGVFLFVLLATSIFSHQLFSSAKPNDTLYIARVISEKAKLNTIINPQSRDKLAMQFANERAQEISAVLADPNFNNDENKDAVAKLNTNFNEEIETIKTRIKHLNSVQNNVAVNNAVNTSSESVLIAENDKDNKGVSLFENPDNKIIVNSGSKIESSSTLKNLNLNVTSTLEIKAASSTGEESNSDSVVSNNEIIDEAQKLFDQKDYTKASDKLKEVNEIIK